MNCAWYQFHQLQRCHCQFCHCFSFGTEAVRHSVLISWLTTFPRLGLGCLRRCGVVEYLGRSPSHWEPILSSTCCWTPTDHSVDSCCNSSTLISSFLASAYVPSSNSQWKYCCFDLFDVVNTYASSARNEGEISICRSWSSWTDWCPVFNRILYDRSELTQWRLDFCLSDCTFWKVLECQYLEAFVWFVHQILFEERLWLGTEIEFVRLEWLIQGTFSRWNFACPNSMSTFSSRQLCVQCHESIGQRLFLFLWLSLVWVEPVNSHLSSRFGTSSRFQESVLLSSLWSLAPVWFNCVVTQATLHLAYVSFCSFGSFLRSAFRSIYLLMLTSVGRPFVSPDLNHECTRLLFH